MNAPSFTTRADMERWMAGCIDDAAARSKALIGLHKPCMASSVIAEASDMIMTVVRNHLHLPKGDEA